MRMNSVKITKTGKFQVCITVIGLLLLLTIILLVTSCRGNIPGERVTLEIVPGDTTADNYEGIRLDMEGNYVLRCASSIISGNELSIETSKSKSMKANYLIFVKQIDLVSSQLDVVIAIAPIVGKEYEYDMTQARFYTVEILSAEKVIEVYGIPFTDWLNGACSSSEKFPCCE